MKGKSRTTKAHDTKASKELGKDEDENDFQSMIGPPANADSSEVPVPPNFIHLEGATIRNNNNYEKEDRESQAALNAQLYSAFAPMNMCIPPVNPAPSLTPAFCPPLPSRPHSA